MKSPTISKDKGFTLIEIAVVLAIITLLFAIGFFVDLSMDSRNSLGSEETTLISILEKARGEAMNNIDHISHGVHVETNAYILFEGSNYAPSDTLNEVIKKNKNISISGLNDIAFKQLSGKPNNPGQIILDDGTQQKTIKVMGDGLVDW